MNAKTLGADEMLALIKHSERRPVPQVDPRRAQLLALFDQADERGKLAMINCGAFHARYPKEG